LTPLPPPPGFGAGGCRHEGSKNCPASTLRPRSKGGVSFEEMGWLNPPVHSPPMLGADQPERGAETAVLRGGQSVHVGRLAPPRSICSKQHSLQSARLGRSGSIFLRAPSADHSDETRAAPSSELERSPVRLGAALDDAATGADATGTRTV